MAEKSETLVTKEERIKEAKELFGRGSRNYCMKQYSDAADDLSECCSIYSEVYGPNAEELGLPYLMYAKSLIALGKDENNLLVAEDGEEEEDDDDDEDGEGEGEGEGDGENEVEDKEQAENNDKKTEDEAMDTKESSNETEAVTATDKENGKDKEADDNKPEKNEGSESVVAGTSGSKDANGDEPQPGPSTSNGGDMSMQEDAADNLQVAWEILELAVNIFQQQGEKGYDNLPECYIELAGISFENSFFKEAIKDYLKALEIYKKTKTPDLRLLAEVNYKVGLSYMMEKKFVESIQSFKGAVSELEKLVEEEKAKEQTDDIKETILDLEQMKMEILDKITDIEDALNMPIEDVKRELSKILSRKAESVGKEFDNGAGTSSAAGSSNGCSSKSSSGVTSSKPATDISHLIKRKKPDTVTTEVEGSPAKKTASESENVAAASQNPSA